jgi:hypothetical protein
MNGAGLSAGHPSPRSCASEPYTAQADDRNLSLRCADRSPRRSALAQMSRTGGRVPIRESCHDSQNKPDQDRSETCSEQTRVPKAEAEHSQRNHDAGECRLPSVVLQDPLARRHQCRIPTSRLPAVPLRIATHRGFSALTGPSRDDSVSLIQRWRRWSLGRLGLSALITTSGASRRASDFGSSAALGIVPRSRRRALREGCLDIFVRGRVLYRPSIQSATHRTASSLNTKLHPGDPVGEFLLRMVPPIPLGPP